MVSLFIVVSMRHVYQTLRQIKIHATKMRCHVVRVDHCTSAARAAIRLTIRTLHTHTHAILPDDVYNDKK